MKNLNWKRLLLVTFLLALLLGLSGCLIKPDKTVEETPTEPVQMLPFDMTTPTPTPPPEDIGQSGWEGLSTETSGTVVVTSAPTPTPTIQLITASPTPVPTATPTPRPTATPTPKPTSSALRNGSSGDAVKQLQQKLKELGYYTGSVDGVFGAGTESALRDFQKANGLSVDGVAGTRTLSTLNSGKAVSKAKNSAYSTSRPTPVSYTPSTLSTYRYLQLGSSGADVKRLQNRLKELGYYAGSVNGNFGTDTESAVLAFQKRNGLWIDGVAGEDTQRMLFSASALAYGGSIQTNTAAPGYQPLQAGASGADVEQLQSRLAELYYYGGSVNGKYDSATELAIKVFQQRNHLNADGVAGVSTQSALYSSVAISAPTAQPVAAAFKAGATMQSGDTGDAVLHLQERLFELGYYTGGFDGIYSADVVSAVRAFQRANGISADGKAGSATQKKLYDSTSVVAAGATDETLHSLQEGDEGERVRALQSLLANYGYFDDAVDGVYGVTTVTAVQQLQATNNIAADGVAGPATLQLLYWGNPARAAVIEPEAAPTPIYEALVLGMSGPNVMQMQQHLQDQGYYFDALNGEFNAETKLALQLFQDRNSLKPDGIAGQETLALLYSNNGLFAEQYYQAATQASPRSIMDEGNEGQDVFDLQYRLQLLGYLASEPSGYYDAETIAAVKAFQTKNGLAADGVAGQGTQKAMYATGVVSAALAAPMETVSNHTRELEEQAASGAIQASIAGGGIAASYNSALYFTGGEKGELYVSNGGSEKKLYDAPVSNIHASDEGVTFVSGNKIMRMPAKGGTPQTLLQAGGIEKLCVIADTFYFLDGNTLVKANAEGEMQTLLDNVTDFSIDVYQMAAYTVSEDGIRSIGLNGAYLTTVLSSAVDQVQLCDSVVFYRSGGKIYRMLNGTSTLLVDEAVTWMGIYREHIYFVSGDRLYRCDTMGQDKQVFYEGLTADVSFASGMIYITQVHGGPVTEKLSIE